jgi:nitrite reductase/ring-hydroxylating ferredoxin subunit
MFSALAGYVAGELVYNQGMAVNRAAWVSGPNNFTEVAASDELVEGQMVKFEVEKRPIVLLKHDDGIHAFEGTCPHFGCGLWEGKLEGHTITCQCHGSQFDVTDGTLIHGPATSPLPSYDVREQEGRVQVRLRQ